MNHQVGPDLAPDSAAIPIDRIRLVAFDLDDTLAESKAALSAEMAEVLAELLQVSQVCIISGGRYEQFVSQVLANLPEQTEVAKLHLMPTCGTRYVRHVDGDWREIYAHDLTEDEKSRAAEALESSARRLGFWADDALVRGPRIEDRGSQVTFSALGQQALVADKKVWDVDGSKREELRSAVAVLLPDLEVRAGGSTSIDITRRGIDKAYGMKELANQTRIGLDEMLFVGDRLMPGGNDYPVLELGVACQAVEGPHETIEFLRGLIPQLAQANDTATKEEGAGNGR